MSRLLTILRGDALTQLRHIPDRSVQCCVTSPPYYGLRDYGVDGQIGLEKTPGLFIAKLVAVFRQVRRVMKDDGTLWLNLGDSYNSSAGEGSPSRGSNRCRLANGRKDQSAILRSKDVDMPTRRVAPELKAKDLMMIPARVAMALQADGWYLRSMIPWIKRNVMPESVNDRPTTACEYIFLLSKGADYYYDKSEVMIAASPNTHARLAQDVEIQIGTSRANGGAKTNGNFKAVCGEFPHDSWQDRKLRANPEAKSVPDHEKNRMRAGKNESTGDRTKVGFNARWDAKERKLAEQGSGVKNNSSMDEALAVRVLARNRRNSDWLIESWQGLLGDASGDPLAFIVNPQPFRGAHFATWPPKLVQPMILAGTKAGDVVLDPFFGSGTTGKVALELGRRCIGCELNPEYVSMAEKRCETTVGLAL